MAPPPVISSSPNGVMLLGHGVATGPLELVSPLITGESRCSTWGVRRATAESLTGCTVSCASRSRDSSASTSTRAAIRELQAQDFNVRLADDRAGERDRCSWSAMIELRSRANSSTQVFAGELIEHLGNVEGFLSSARRHLGPGGQLVLTTPNAFYVGELRLSLGWPWSVAHPETHLLVLRGHAPRGHRAQRFLQCRDLLRRATSARRGCARSRPIRRAARPAATPRHGHAHRGATV